jgi:hypothetical protein
VLLDVDLSIGFSAIKCFSCMLIVRESSALAGELTEESDQFRFLRAVCLTNLEGSVVLILVKASAMRVTITIPLDLSTWSFIPLLSHSSCPPSSYSFPSLISSMLCLSGT